MKEENEEDGNSEKVEKR